MASVRLAPFGQRTLAVASAQVSDAGLLKERLAGANVAVLDARLVLDIVQLATAAAACLAAEGAGALMPKSISSELLYRLSGSTKVSDSIHGMSVKGDAQRAVLVALDMTHGELADLVRRTVGDDIVQIDGELQLSPDHGLLQTAYRLPPGPFDAEAALHHICNTISTKDL